MTTTEEIVFKRNKSILISFFIYSFIVGLIGLSKNIDSYGIVGLLIIGMLIATHFWIKKIEKENANSN